MKTKKNLSEFKLLRAKKKQEKKSNPFEVHVNRQKFDVLGRKLKTDRGLPGVSRAKSIKKRKETLLQEYKLQNKSNKFLDRRIGERDRAMTAEDRILARFTAERMKAHNKKAKYNLEEDEILTHKGRSLAEIETHDDSRSDSDDQFDNKGLDGKFVEEAHFGGGTLKRTDVSRTSVIDQLIAESKARKAERTANKERTLTTTERLDSEWKELLPMIGSNSLAVKNDDEEKGLKKDEYDKLLGQLKYEPRGTPQDKLKTEEHLAEEEAKRLRKLEEDRLRRMRGGDEDFEDGPSRKPSEGSFHRSADDLDDGFENFSDEESSMKPYVVEYDREGKLIAPNPDSKHIEECSQDEQAVLDEEEKEDEDTTEDESDGDEIDDLSDMRPPDQTNDIEQEDEEEEYEEEVRKGQITKKRVSFDTEVTTHKYEKEENDPKTVDELEIEKNALSVESSSLPFTFVVPEEYDDFEQLVKSHKDSLTSVIIERMIKCNHPSLRKENREKMSHLFSYILQMLNDAPCDSCWALLDSLAPALFDLAHFSPVDAADAIAEVLAEKQSDHWKKKNKFPGHDTLVFLKLTPILFPASDRRHPVTTPAVALLSSILVNGKTSTRRSIACALFLVSLATQYVGESKRIFPEVMTTIAGLIHMAAPVNASTKVDPPFCKHHKLLYLKSDMSDFGEKLTLTSSDLMPVKCKIDDSFKVRSLSATVALARHFAQLYADTPGSWLLMSSVTHNLSLVNTSNYPEAVKTKVRETLASLGELKARGLPAIVKDAVKPKMLRLYEPNIRPVHDRKRVRTEADDKKRLVKKLRKETKGALREIRRDTSFLAQVKVREQARSDAERIRKVKQIYSWGSQQQGELNKLERQKKRKNKF